jgi:hypothetical protein
VKHDNAVIRVTRQQKILGRRGVDRRHLAAGVVPQLNRGFSVMRSIDLPLPHAASMSVRFHGLSTKKGRGTLDSCKNQQKRK